jgi:hypothetical protein
MSLYAAHTDSLPAWLLTQGGKGVRDWLHLDYCDVYVGACGLWVVGCGCG